METQLLRLVLNNGRLPILFPNHGLTTWRDVGDVLEIRCEDTRGVEDSMGYSQFTVYYVPKSNIQYFGPDVSPKAQFGRAV